MGIKGWKKGERKIERSVYAINDKDLILIPLGPVYKDTYIYVRKRVLRYSLSEPVSASTLFA